MTWDRYKREGADGRAMCKLDNRTWWQSRMSIGGRAELPDLVDLEDLAKKVRASYG